MLTGLSSLSLFPHQLTEESYQTLLLSYRDGSTTVKLQSYGTTSSSTVNNTSTWFPHVFDSPTDRLDQFSTYDAVDNSFRGAVSFRPSRPGSYRIFMIETGTKRLISKIHRVRIQVSLLVLESVLSFFHRSAINSSHRLPIFTKEQNSTQKKLFLLDHYLDIKVFFLLVGKNLVEGSLSRTLFFLLRSPSVLPTPTHHSFIIRRVLGPCHCGIT
jgi:hypothetical protein